MQKVEAQKHNAAIDQLQSNCSNPLHTQWMVP
jgi:hypothetical protein